MKHFDGMPVCEIFQETPDSFGASELQGPIINFNLRRSDGSVVGYGGADRLANLSHISIRAGGFCNPGASQRWLHLNSKDIQENHKAGHVCRDDKDLINGKPTGSMRVSVGPMNSTEDIECFVAFIERYFVERSPINGSDFSCNDGQEYEISSLFICKV